LIKELETLKNSVKSQSNDTFMLYEKEKENLKSKLIEKEEKLRMTEKLKQEYFYELEKEKAKTNVEKESFVMKIEELKEREQLFERGCQEEQVSENDSKLLDEIKNKKSTGKQVEKKKIEIDEFPTI